MKRYFGALCAAGLFALITSCSQTPQPANTHDADVQALRDNEDQWNRDYAAKDLDKVAAHYADDATLITPGEPAMHGKDSIRAALKEMVSDSALSLKFQASRVDVAKSGDVGYTEGAYTLTVTDPVSKKPVNDKGSYVTVYRKQSDGSWKAISDIASSATPPGAPPSAAKM